MQVHAMTIERDYVLAYLRKLEKQYGRYFGTDILNLATELGVTWHGLRKKLHEWFKEDPDFFTFHYLGRVLSSLRRIGNIPPFPEALLRSLYVYIIFIISFTKSHQPTT
jgi:hypothetical protein